MMTSLIGWGGLGFGAGSALAAGSADPPVFATTRHQFTLMEPAVPVSPVLLGDAAGRPKMLAPERGKILLLNVWAMWCEACQLDLPLLQRFHDARGGQVRVAAVSTDGADRVPEIKPYLAKLGISSLPVYADPHGRLASNVSSSDAPFRLLWGIPATYLITPSGHAVGYITGVVDWLSGDAQNLLSYYGQA